MAQILVIINCAVIARAKTLVETAEWANDAAHEQLASHEISATHATTIACVFQRLDTDTSEFLLSTWVQSLTTSKAITVDGKEVRGTKNGGQDRMHLTAALDKNTGAVCAQVPVGTKTKNGRRSIRTLKQVTVTTGIRFPNAAQALQINRKSRTIGQRRGAL